MGVYALECCVVDGEGGCVGDNCSWICTPGIATASCNIHEAETSQDPQTDGRKITRVLILNASRCLTCASLLP